MSLPLSLLADKPVSSLNPRFGWNNHDDRPKAEDYLFELRADDFKNQDQLILKKSVIQKMAKALIRKKDDFSSPGFFYIPNLAEFTDSIEEMQAFQSRLVKKIFNQTHQHFNLLNPFCTIEKEKLSSLPNSLDFLGPQHLHWDKAPESFVSLLYDESKNMKGGEVIIGDFRQFEMDKGLSLDRGQINATMMVEDKLLTREKHQGFMDDYVIKLDKNKKNGQHPLIFSNNNRERGVMHNGDTAFIMDEKQPASRELFRYRPHSGLIKYRLSVVIERLIEWAVS